MRLKTMRKRIKKFKELAVKEVVEEGKSYNEVGKKYGVHRSTIMRWVEKVEDKYEEKTWRKLEEEDKKKAVKEVLVDGKMQLAVAEKYGVHRTTLWRWIQKYEYLYGD